MDGSLECNDYLEPSVGTDIIGYHLRVPGIIYVDLYVYIKESRFGEFKSFKLRSVVEQLKLTDRKGEIPMNHFFLPTFMCGGKVTADMAIYNMMDSKLLIDIMQRMSLCTEILSLCSIARASIDDVAVYNTGAIAISSVVHECHDRGYRFVWRNKFRFVDEFPGAHIEFKVPLMASGVICIDIKSAYPTAIIGGCISLENSQITDMDSTMMFVDWVPDKNEHLSIVRVGSKIRETTYYPEHEGCVKSRIV